MTIKTIINPDFPSLYRYMIICVLEKRGKHQISDIENEPRITDNNDINFLCNYINNSFNLLNYDDKTIRFLKDIKSIIKNQSKIEFHLTRDYQVIETGNHYISIVFRIKRNNFIDNIKFSAKFKQKMDDYPLGDNKIYISYYRDHLKKFKNCSHTIFKENITYYREKIFNSNLDIENSNKCFNADYLIPENYVCKPNLSLEACIIC